ncbi:MAG: FIST C-terminal domain-containing protein [Proteobacteria bacterium]|nr:FIST C-terminal domain-containing protein [Pseudomonadota bacterium]
MSPTTFIHAHATHPDWRVALAEAQRQVASEIAARAERHGEAIPFTLGWCYLTDYYALAVEVILDELRLTFPGITWIGTVGLGVAASGVEYIDEPALVLMVAPLPLASFRVFSGRQPLPTAATGFVPHTALVHAEGSTPDLQELLQELSDRTATGYLFGGLSSSRQRTVHMADGVFTGGLSGIAFGPEVNLISLVTQGCQPIGPVRQVTQAERNLLVSLDGRAALDCVMRDLGLDQDASDDDLYQALSSTLVGLSSVAEDVLTEIRDNVESDLTQHMAGALYVSCSGSGGPHFGARHAELQILRNALGDIPLVGFFAGGEIARHHLYGYTGVLTVFLASKKVTASGSH